MKLKVTYESGDEIVTITWTPEYGFDIAGNKALVDKFTTEEIQPRGQAVEDAYRGVLAPPEPALRSVPTLGHDDTDASGPEAGKVKVRRNGEDLWVYPDDLTEEEQEWAAEAEAAIERAIAEAGGDADGDDGIVDEPEPETRPAKKAAGKRKPRAKPKCQACNHAWHSEECQVLIGTDQTKQPCGCLTAVM